MGVSILAANDALLALGARESQRLESGKLLTKVQAVPPGVEVKALVRCTPERMLEILTDYPAMPQRIFGLERADVLRSNAGISTVSFAMKLPFPVGRIEWTNLISTRTVGGIHSLEWTLLDGDLDINDGRLVMMTHRGNCDLTYANYTVRVQSRTALPRSAQRLATRWLLPKIVDKLRRVAEEQ